ncbi:MAG: YecA family protein [Halanaerobium sp.]
MNKNYKEFLASYTKSDLIKIRQYWNFSGISQLNKAELVDVLDQKIKDNLKEWLSYQSSKEVEFLKKLIKEQQQSKWVEIAVKDILPPALNNFQGHGIIDIKDTETERSVRIPAELSAEIAEIITDLEFQEEIKNNNRLLQFARGLLAYYGALSFMQLIEFYDFYFEVETEPEKIHHFLKLINEAFLNTFDIEYFDHYYLYSGVFNPEEIIREIKMRPQIDYYKPAKKDILYAGKHDREKLNFSQQKFRKILLKDFSLSEDEVEEIIWTMMLDIKNDRRTIEIIQELGAKLEFDVFEQAQDFFQEMNEFHNNTRLWILKGHTPNEIMEEERKHLRPLPKNEYQFSSHVDQVVKGKKVGRNDPCPCGSGKKYKKCCLGKN